MAVEHAVAEIHVARMRLGAEFERQISDMALDGGPAISCRKGCAHCCSHPVTCTVLEGVSIYRWLVSCGRWAPSLRKRLATASDLLLGLSPAVWLMMNQPCAFLADDRSCTVYMNRPIQCRTVFSVDKPDDCHPHRLQPHAILPRHEPLAAFAVIEKEQMDRIGMMRWQIPIATSVLFAEKLSTGELDVEQIDAKLTSLYAETA